jgi:hypothetical protein
MLSVDALMLSWTQSFLFINILVIIVVVPPTLTLVHVASAPGLGAFFPQAFAFLLVIYAANFGQVQGNPEQPWRYHYRQNFFLYATHLGVRLTGLLLLSLPLWVVYYHLFHLQLSTLIAFVYLWLLAQLWGWFGLWLSLMGFSEINQFKIKYIILLVYLASTLFVPPLSPFLTVQAMLDSNAATPWWFMAIAFVTTGAGLVAFAWLNMRRLQQMSTLNATQ